ncbi:MAG: 23S rRNA pseudouridine synthase [Parcubacteria group bacterium Gr01-1014_44]|nr:MAG: 23S rRNA pseudouridine synthase [Parcubacteria group bacterium Gr01-1014_44]
MRINQYLAWQKHSTRRGGDELVEKGRVFINGKLAQHGDKVTENDKVEVLKNKNKKPYLYFAYHKSRGIATEDIRAPEKSTFPLGRLDKISHGLMLFTNDGRVTDRLLNPEYSHDKEYVVKTAEKLRSSFKKNMEAGVDIEGYVTKKCQVEILDEFSFRLTLTEGKKHQIRRMCSALFQQVRDLKRVRIMNIALGKLPPGDYRPIKGQELADFLKSLGL